MIEALERKGSWVVMGDRGDEMVRCTRCGRTLEMALPVDLPVFLAASRAFLRVHNNCHPTAAQAAQAYREANPLMAAGEAEEPNEVLDEEFLNELREIHAEVEARKRLHAAEEVPA